VLLASTPTAAAVCFAMAACAAFAAHEPFLVVLGQRGSRALREERQRALRRLLVASATGLAAGLLAIALSPAARPWAAAPVAFAAATLVFILRRSERTLVGELFASASLIAAALPTAVANGLSPRVAVAACAVFYATTLLSTVEVRAIARRGTSFVARGAGWLLSGLIVFGLAIAAPYFALCALPALVTTVVLVASRPPPASLRRVGWTLATASLLTTVAIVIAARAAF
jgi:hypothetical protein